MVRHLRSKGADAAYLDLANFDMPLFNEDLLPEEQPRCALELANLLAEADAVFIASPEYNGSLTPLLKNTIDWFIIKSLVHLPKQLLVLAPSQVAHSLALRRFRICATFCPRLAPDRPNRFRRWHGLTRL